MRKSLSNTKSPPKVDEILKSAKENLLPKTGKDLPIDINLVGCTQALFFEYKFQTTSPITAPYCLKPYNHIHNGITYRSMYLIYMTCDSEYEAAMKLLGNYVHWQKLKKASWFIPYLEVWNAELVLREQALAKSKLIDLTEAGNVTAARTLLVGKAIPKEPSYRTPKRADDSQGHDLDNMLKRTKEAMKITH